MLHQQKKEKTKVVVKPAASEATVSAALPATIKAAAPVLYDKIDQNEEEIKLLNEKLTQIDQ